MTGFAVIDDDGDLKLMTMTTTMAQLIRGMRVLRLIMRIIVKKLIKRTECGDGDGERDGNVNCD